MPSKKNFRRPVIEWIIFEDFNAPLKAPLNLIRPVWDLVSGKETLMGRIKRVFSGKFSFIHRFSEDPLRYTGWCINGSALWEQMPALDKNLAYEENEIPLFFYAENLSREDFFCPERLKNALKNKKPAKAKAVYLKTLADFMACQEKTLFSDLNPLISKESPDAGVILLGSKNRVLLDSGAVLHPGAAVDTRQGPVFIGKGAEVMPFSLIQGPAFIGENTLIDGAQVRPGCSLMRGCKIGGEVEASIFLEFTNKHHQGFVGHSYAGSFVNFGAGSTTSDLKNNYGAVSFFAGEEKISTGIMKLGSFIGDHAKLGIGTLLSSGSSVGVGASVFGGRGVLPQFIPSFAWGEGYPFNRYRWAEFEANTLKIMARRKQIPGPADLEILKNLYENQLKEGYEKMPSGRKNQ